MHVFRSFAGPDYAKVNAWCHMPGWATVTEALTRGEHPANNHEQAFNIASRSYVCLTYSIRGPAALHGKISLAGTARKLLWPFMQRKCNQRAANRGHLAEMAKMMATLVTGLEALHLVSNSTKDADQTADRSSKSGAANQGVAHDPALSGSLLKQLKAILLITLVQATLWRIEVEGLVGSTQSWTPEWLVSVLGLVEKRLDTDLRDAARSLLGGSLLRASQQTALDVGTTWERCAVFDFRGRLLPGCCNLGCGNLTGVSEATLETLLCAGCRGARYCSVACQRAAWRDGGHSIVCGKFKL